MCGPAAECTPPLALVLQHFLDGPGVGVHDDRYIAVLVLLAVVDVPGAFMQGDMDELVHVWFTGKMVELLLMIDRKCMDLYVTYEGQEKVMYVDFWKNFYDTVRAARLVGEKLRGLLLEWGIEANPYDS